MTLALRFNVTEVDGHRSLSVFGSDGFSKVVDQGHPYFQAILAALIEEPQDVLRIQGLIDPEVGIREAMAKVSDRVTVDRFNVYVDGMAAHGALAKHIITKIHAGDSDWGRFVLFLLSLWENPSKRAQDAVWEWVEKHGVTITEDGLMVGYKGLVNGTDAVTGETNVPVSYHSGPNNFIDGRLYGEADVHYNVPHRVGSVVSKRRADVDDNTSLACSTGLHVGAYDYAKTFGENRADGARYSTMGRMADTLPNSTFALVAFAGQDVVSVPEDDTADWKIRVERYEVLEFLDTVNDVLNGKASYDAPTTSVPGSVPDVKAPFGDQVEVPEVVPAPFTEARDAEPQPVVGQPWHGVRVSETTEALDDEDYDDEQDGADLDAVAGDPVLPETTVADAEGNLHDAQGTPSAALTLSENAALVPDLNDDLNNRDFGHKPLARKWSTLTSEASVRRYRNSNGIKVSLRTRVLG